MSESIFSDDRTEPSLGTSPAADSEAHGASEGFGSTLRQAREACGYSVGDLVARLRISVSQIRAIETEQVNELPEPVYVCGFIRSYAKILGLDPEPLVSDYKNRYAGNDYPYLHQIPRVAYSKEEEFLGQPSSRGWRLAAVALVVAAVAAGLWALVEQQRMAGQAPSPETTATEAVAEAAPAVPAPAAEHASPPPPPPPPPAARVPEPSLPEVIAVAENAPAPQGRPSVAVRVMLRPQDRCYLRIEELAGERKVAADTEVAGGQAFEVETRTPFRMVLGYPNDAVLEVSGSRVDLSPFVNPRSGTARLRIY